jgi:carboxypeptidase Taq
VDAHVAVEDNRTDQGASGGLMGVMHETGHALYERGLPTAYARQPVGKAAGMAVHESQALIVEMQACRSDGYVAWLAPQLLATFDGDPGAYEPANLSAPQRRGSPVEGGSTQEVVGRTW